MPYTQQQTVFVLSMLSNLAISQNGPVDALEQYLAQHIDAHLLASQPDIGVWTRAWGPAVFQAPRSSVADNVMYVAKNNATPPQYVVAIAGTSYHSVWDVLIEDFLVSVQTPWIYGNPPAASTPRISAGTFIGLGILQVLMPGAPMPGANQTLTTFLSGVTSQAIELIATGHSLGGALSPALALWLSDTRSLWDPAGRATISCEPTAGPTAGNGDFAAYYGTSLGPRTTRLHNSLDIVPHAWQDSDLAQLPALYQPAIQPDIVVDALVATARALVPGRDYQQINETTPPLSGTVNTSIVDPARPAFENYLVQAGYQHIDAYFTLLQVTISAEAMAAVRTAMGVPAAQRAAVRLQAQLERRRAIRPQTI